MPLYLELSASGLGSPVLNGILSGSDPIGLCPYKKKGNSGRDQGLSTGFSPIELGEIATLSMMLYYSSTGRPIHSVKGRYFCCRFLTYKNRL